MRARTVRKTLPLYRCMKTCDELLKTSDVKAPRARVLLQKIPVFWVWKLFTKGRLDFR